MNPKQFVYQICWHLINSISRFLIIFPKKRNPLFSLYSLFWCNKRQEKRRVVMDLLIMFHKCLPNLSERLQMHSDSKMHLSPKMCREKSSRWCKHISQTWNVLKSFPGVFWETLVKKYENSYDIFDLLLKRKTAFPRSARSGYLHRLVINQLRCSDMFLLFTLLRLLNKAN